MSTPGPFPAYMTITEVAAALRISKMTAYRLVHSGELHAVRVSPRTFRVSEQAVRDYLAASAIGGGQ